MSAETREEMNRKYAASDKVQREKNEARRLKEIAKLRAWGETTKGHIAERRAARRGGQA